MDLILPRLREIGDKKDVKIYLVGGYIRDYLLNKSNEDIDFVVEKDAEIVAKEFAESINGKLITLGGRHKFYRVVDSKRNVIVDISQLKGNDINEDLLNRDFTINSLAVDIDKIENGEISNENIIDVANGLDDLNKGIIRHVKDNTFEDDPIRMLRAVRFMSQLEFELDDTTKRLIKRNKEKIKDMPYERITHELFKLLKYRRTYYYFNYMDRTLNILEEIFPEIEPMREIGKCKYHVVDSLTHSIYTLKVAEDIIYADGYFEDHVRKAYEEHTKKIVASDHTRLDLIKLGAFFHDVGKPSAKKVDETGRIRFKGHEITGAEIVKKIAERLKLSIKERDLLYKMVAKHMLPLVLYKNNDVSGKALYGMFSELKEDTLDILLISLADIIATRKLLYPGEEMGKFKVHIEYMANNYLTRYKEIEKISNIITGKEIMQKFDLGENVLVGDLLEEVRKAIYYGKISANKEAALRYIEQIL
ncbi:CCA tRNA nucleotidyltransferase [Caloranaerobacter azorensis]|uniref:Polynucleotide adenylyltransferase n=2 Tax=Caloranaerobacter azorensis TaxID=116090 RepID=A0A096DNP2_9FIRM|nr:HD domain-containing protein [Caloranaerobacter azorensis]KGG80881.1 polynucleotide adenylyltransferase [Caloranaerobacter azorensis H53214]QIB27790.1 HD domain-containing protein [Caloranaerobacter azorensis]